MADRATRAPRVRRLLATITVAVVVVDQVSKALAVHYLSGRGIVNVLGGAFHLQLYRNFAGSGNRFTGHPVLVSVLALLAVVAIGTIAMRVRSRSAAVAGGLLLGGGIGNLLDRLLRAPGPLRGGVVDWLKPTVNGGSMNLSDVAIAAGVAVIVVAALVGAWRSRSERPVPGEV
jgi:signal peptidase II